MITIESNTADQMYMQAFNLLNDPNVFSIVDSRNGPNREILHFGFQLNNPKQRFIVSRKPPINITFAMAEVVWIMRGRNDSKFLNYWNNALPKYAGETHEYHGSYGYRIRKHFGHDQLEQAYNTLKHQSNSRQVVLQIWDSTKDLPKVNGQPESKDIPCNLLSMIKVRNNKLEWTQIMRSNDFYRGLPYNIIQFTVLQEVLAGWLGIEMGSYNHFSDSLHSYIQDLEKFNMGSIIQQNNSLNLSLPKNESEHSFSILESIIERLIQNNITQKEIVNLISNSNLNNSYNDILILFCVECSRRHKWIELSKELINTISNQDLKSMWLNWDYYLSMLRDSENGISINVCK